MSIADALPFEDGQDTIRDLTTLNAKRMIAIVRKVARAEVDQQTIVLAREITLDIKARQQRRHRENRQQRKKAA
jgi:hypothetical protein